MDHPNNRFDMIHVDVDDDVDEKRQRNDIFLTIPPPPKQPALEYWTQVRLVQLRGDKDDARNFLRALNNIILP